jgi:hypothetical protein
MGLSGGICALRFLSGLGGSGTLGINMGRPVSYVDLNLTAGTTCSYRLEALMTNMSRGMAIRWMGMSGIFLCSQSSGKGA